MSSEEGGAAGAMNPEDQLPKNEKGEILGPDGQPLSKKQLKKLKHGKLKLDKKDKKEKVRGFILLCCCLQKVGVGHTLFLSLVVPPLHVPRTLVPLEEDGLEHTRIRGYSCTILFTLFL